MRKRHFVKICENKDADNKQEELYIDLDKINSYQIKYNLDKSIYSIKLFINNDTIILYPYESAFDIVLKYLLGVK